jgi:YD repeat-containing protein
VGSRRSWARCSSAAFVAICFSGLAVAIPPDETPPTIPGNFTATAVSSSQINLSWSLSSDNRGVTGYTINRCVGSSCTVILTAASTQTSFSNTNGLSSGVTYTYSILAFDAAGNQSEGAFASATTPDVVAPSAPGGLLAVPSGSQIDLSWSQSTDNVGVTGYQIFSCSGVDCSSFSQLTSTSATIYNATGLGSAVSYSFRVRAYDAASNVGGFSNTASATTADSTPPSGPSSLSATALPSGTQIDLGWPAASDNVGVVGYVVERCTGAGCGSFSQVANITSTSYSSTSLASSTSYSFRVRAYDARSNYGSYTPTATAVTPDASPPSAPASLTATAASTTEINLSWLAASDNVGVSGYAIERCSGAGCGGFAQIGTSTVTSYGASGLAAGTAYSFRVRAYDAVPSYGGYSPVASATTQGSPPSPSETIKYEYDALGRLIKVVHSGTVNNGEQSTYGYDAAGNRINMTVTPRD